MSICRLIAMGAVWMELHCLVLGQNSFPQNHPAPEERVEADAVGLKSPADTPANLSLHTTTESPDSVVRIGPDDELDIVVYGVSELSQHVRVGADGQISMPLIGNVHLAGLSSNEAQRLIEKRLVDGNFIKQPHVMIYVKEYTTEGISIVGEVNKPGVYPSFVAHRLYDLIEKAGGLTVKAGKTITIAHRSDPQHPVTIELKNDTFEIARNNVDLRPGDTVVASKAGVVYVVGEVNRPGGFVLENNQVSALQAIVMAGGPTHLAALNGSKLIRRHANGLKESPLPLKRIMRAKVADLQLEPDDIIYVPGSKAKSIANTGSVLSMVTTLALYRY